MFKTLGKQGSILPKSIQRIPDKKPQTSNKKARRSKTQESHRRISMVKYLQVLKMKPFIKTIDFS